MCRWPHSLVVGWRVDNSVLVIRFYDSISLSRVNLLSMLGFRDVLNFYLHINILITVIATGLKTVSGT